MDQALLDLMQTLLYTHPGVYKKFMTNPDFKQRYQEFVFDVHWQKANTALERHVIS